MARPRCGIALLAIASLAVACRHWPVRERAFADCPGALVSTDAMAGDFLLRQSVRVFDGERAQALQLIAQKRDGELLLLGLDPFGAELFTLHQRGVDTRVEALPPRLLAVPPENLLRDLHRIRFLRVPGGPADGDARIRLGETEIVEIWQAGALRQRILRPLSGGPGSAVVLVFAPPGAAEASVEIRNPGCGYSAEFTTLSEQRLP